MAVVGIEVVGMEVEDMEVGAEVDTEVGTMEVAMAALVGGLIIMLIAIAIPTNSDL